MLDGYTYEMYEAEQERANKVRLRQQRAWEQAEFDIKESEEVINGRVKDSYKSESRKH